MNTLQTLTFSVRIRAPRKKIWETMLKDSTYREWADVFSPGSYYTGDWSEGSEMRFLAPGKDGTIAGLISTIMEIRPHEFLAIEHQGSIHEGKEDYSSYWAGALETYTFEDAGDGTDMLVTMDVDDTHKKTFGNLWPKALRKLKELAEK